MGTNQNTKSAHNESVAPATALAYLDPKYWDERFSKEEHYECGNSKLSEELYNDGITHITCIDLSAVAVEKMQRRLRLKGMKVPVGCALLSVTSHGLKSNMNRKSRLEEHYSTIIYVLEADMLDMPFGNECFDVVVEKGTMDVLFVDGGDPWNPQPSTRAKVMAMLEGVHRVLKKDGIFVSVTFGQPHFRRPLFSAPEFTWSFECSTFGDGFHYFLYTLRKGRRLPSDKGEGERFDEPSICLLQDELEGEDYMFRTDVDELNC
ncbi:methyltransferase-like protein 13 isoform X2 [Cucumis melo var. makuwa]|uniref:Methyltransferase-like protein 13 isoform X2 n=1 Tax=Cucumis melo var. makuwa TaxID=1194695 RepID=A0A5D3C5Z9_CUCMM|nr:methyltransferase-like protein 13 isoform X2 [Cucumis melo var. makuwa]